LLGKMFFPQVAGDISVRICHSLHHSSLSESVCEFYRFAEHASPARYSSDKLQVVLNQNGGMVYSSSFAPFVNVATRAYSGARF